MIIYDLNTHFIAIIKENPIIVTPFFYSSFFGKLHDVFHLY